MKKFILSTILVSAAMFPYVVHAEAATKSSAVQLSTQTATINTNNVNIRKGAGTTYSVISNLSKGQKVEIIGSMKNQKGETWYNIKFGGKTGWVLSTFATKSGSQNIAKTNTQGMLLVATRNARLYETADLNSKKVEKLPANSTVFVISEEKDPTNNLVWVQIMSESENIGWTPKYELVASKSVIRYIYALDNSQVFKDTTNQTPALATLRENDQVMVLQEADGWLNIETKTGIRGWMLKTQASTTQLKRLINPQVVPSGKNSYITWSKPYNFSFKYTTISNNQLKLTQGFTYAQIPKAKVKGIKEIKSIREKNNERSLILTFEPGYTFTIRNYNDKVSIKVVPKGLIGKTIIIDAGHGGHDPGAIGPTRLKEKDVNLNTALLLRRELIRAGAIVKMTRSTDVFLELNQRTAIANASDYDAFISIHSDSATSTARGTTTYYNQSVNFNGLQSLKLATSVQKGIIPVIKTTNRGVKHQLFYVNRMNELPSILVELGYISNRTEESLLRSKDFRQKAAVGIRKGLQDYFNNF
jgi:N-acetylmuramoyl-L-alanine amidase